MCVQLVDELRKLLCNDDEDTPALILHYGSRLKDRDIDVLIIYNHEPIHRELVLGRVDLCAMSVNNAIELVKLYDPIVTEPLITGQKIHGDTGTLNILNTSLREAKVTDSALRHLLLRCFRSYTNATECLDMSRENPYARLGVVNLSYAVSYLEFAKFYGNNPVSAIPLTRLKEHFCSATREMWVQIEEFKQMRTLKVGNVEGLIRDFERMLLT